MTMQPVVVGDAASQVREIDLTDFIVGWKTSGNPDEAVALDTLRDLLEVRARSVLRQIILAEAPTGLTLSDLTIEAPLTLKLGFMIGSNAAELTVDFTTHFVSTGEPQPIAGTGDHGREDAFTHPDHAHRLPKRTLGETPVVDLDTIANAPVSGRGKHLGFHSTTGVPEFQDAGASSPLGTANPQPVGGANAPRPGVSTDHTPIDHEHAVAPRSVGLGELKTAPTAADHGKVIGYDAAGNPVAILPGSGTFIGDTDTPSAYGTKGQVPEINTAMDALVFGGPYQPLEHPSDPTNLRATDAFDMALEVSWNIVANAAYYEWQTRTTGASWPAGDGNQSQTTSARTTPIPLGTYDFRVRAVSPNGHLKSNWVELASIPVIATPVPAASTSNVLTRVRSRTLRFAWQDLDVNNGGSGAARVSKHAEYEYQHRLAGTNVWPSAVGHDTSTSVQTHGPDGWNAL